MTALERIAAKSAEKHGRISALSPQTPLEKIAEKCGAIAEKSRNEFLEGVEKRKIQGKSAPLILPNKSDYTANEIQFKKIVSCMKLLAGLFKTTLLERKNYYEVRRLSEFVVMRFHRIDGKMEFFMTEDDYGRKVRKQITYIEKMAQKLTGGEKPVAPAPNKVGINGAEKYVAEIGTEKVHQPLAYVSIKTPSGRSIGCAEATTFYGKGYTEKTPRSKGARMKGCKLTSGITE